jgi:hypothetical protein
VAISLVQSKSATGTSGTSLTITLSSATTAGNCIVVCLGSTEATDNPTISGITLGGSAGNFAASNTAYSNSNVNAAIWANPNCAGGDTSIVITLTGGSGGSTSVQAYAMEFSGLATGSVLDKAPAGQNGSSASWTSGSTGTLSQASEVAIGVIFTDNTGTLTTPGSPWTELTQLSASGGKLGVGYQVVSATTALTYSGTVSSSSDYGCCVITLKAAAGTSVSLQTATNTIAAHTLGVSAGPVQLQTATVSVAAYPVTPLVTHIVPLVPATVSVAAHPLTIPRTIALAHAAVTVAAYAVTPVVTTPTLVFSIASEPGIDPWGNPYVPGFVAYSTGVTPQVITQLDNGNLAFSSPAFPDGDAALVEGIPGGLYLLSGSQTDESFAQISLLSASASGTGQSTINLIADEVLVNGSPIG